RGWLAGSDCTPAPPPRRGTGRRRHSARTTVAGRSGRRRPAGAAAGALGGRAGLAQRCARRRAVPEYARGQQAGAAPRTRRRRPTLTTPVHLSLARPAPWRSHHDSGRASPTTSLTHGNALARPASAATVASHPSGLAAG